MTESSLTVQDQKILLKIARDTIKFTLHNRKAPRQSDIAENLTEPLKAERAAFVTLTIGGMLRGCIGDIFPCDPLYLSVMRNAVNAAFKDPRFPQLSPAELEKLEIEISALTPPKQVPDYSDIRIGTDGIVLSKGRAKAVFLPQVAPEQGWNLQQTLTHLARKAGLGPDDWKQGARFEVFQAEVFNEAVL